MKKKKKPVKQGTRVIHPEYGKGVVYGYGDNSPTSFAIYFDKDSDIRICERASFKRLKTK